MAAKLLAPLRKSEPPDLRYIRVDSSDHSSLFFELPELSRVLDHARLLAKHVPSTMFSSVPESLTELS